MFPSFGVQRIIFWVFFGGFLARTGGVSFFVLGGGGGGQGGQIIERFAQRLCYLHLLAEVLRL